MRRTHTWKQQLMAVTLILGLCGTAEAHPDLVDTQSSSARSAVLKAFPGAVIRDWQPAPMTGLYMFTLNQSEQVYFVDAKGQYLMAQAAVFDMQSQKNLTQDFILKRRQELLHALSYENAIMYRPSTVQTKPILIFDDPDCPFCREMHGEVKTLVNAGVPVAVFLHPVERIHRGATQKSVNIWCAENRAEVLDQALAGKPVPEGKACEAPIEANLSLARQLGGGPTPYIVLPDGRSIAGKKSAADVMTMLGLTPPLAQQLGQ